MDGTVGLGDIALLNDFLAVDALNERLAREAMEKGRKEEPLGPGQSQKSDLERMAERSNTRKG